LQQISNILEVRRKVLRGFHWKFNILSWSKVILKIGCDLITLLSWSYMVYFRTWCSVANKELWRTKSMCSSS